MIALENKRLARDRANRWMRAKGVRPFAALCCPSPLVPLSLVTGVAG